MRFLSNSHTRIALIPFFIVAILQLQNSGINAAFALDIDWKVQAVEGERRLEAQDLEGAEASMREALKLAKRNKSCTALEIASCMQNLGSVLQMQSKTDEVIPLYLKSLHVLEAKYGKKNVNIVHSLILLGTVYETECDYPKAAKFYEQAILITQSNPAPDSLALADYQHRLGRVSFASGLLQQAESNYKSSLAILMMQMDQSSGDLLSALLADYIDLFCKNPDRGRALGSKFQNELLKDRLDKLDRTMGVTASIWNKEVSGKVSNPKNSGRIDASATYTDGSAINSKSNFQKEEDRIFQAAPGRALLPTNTAASDSQSTLDALTLDKINKQRVDFYERMIAADIDSLGASHPSVARDLSGLASIYLLQNNYDSAKPLLSRALEIYKGVYSGDALPVRRTESLLNYISEKQMPAKSETVASNDYAKGLPSIPLSAQKLEIVLKLNYLAFLNYSHGKIQDAANLYAWALADTILSCGTDNGLLASCLSDYSRVLSSSGKSAEAQLMENSAQYILKKELAKEAALSLP